MAIIYRTAGVWGPGKGTDLDPAEVDNNFHEHAVAIANIIANFAAPNNIASIEVDGDQMTFTFEDTTTLGPFALPVADLRFIGDFPPVTGVERGQMFREAGALWYITKNHTTAATFNPDAGDIDGPYYQFMFASPSVFDIGWHWPGNNIGEGLDPAEDPMFAYTPNRTMIVPADLLESNFVMFCDEITGNSDGELVFTFYHDTTAVGTVTFEAASAGPHVPVISFPEAVTVAPGEVFWLSPPGEVDATAKNFVVNIRADFPSSEESSESESESV